MFHLSELKEKAAKTTLFYFLTTAIVLFLMFPVYYQPVIQAEITISTPFFIKTSISHVSSDDGTLTGLGFFSTTGSQNLPFSIPKKTPDKIRILFSANIPTEVTVGALKLGGKIFLPAPGQKEIKLFVEKESKIFFENLSGSSVYRFYFSVFIGIFFTVSALFWILRKNKTSRLLFAATTGYIGIVVNCKLYPTHMNMLFGVLIFSFLFYFYKQLYKKHPPFNGFLAAAGIIFGTVNILSVSLYRFDSWNFIAQNSLLCLLGLIGQGIMFYAVGLSFFDFMSGRFFLEPYTGKQYLISLIDFYRRRTILCVFLIILICWLPWHFVYYPGIFPWDSKGQIKQILDLLPKTQRHPTLSTLLFGACFKIGVRIKDYSLGIYFYTALQSCVLAFIFALCQNRIKQLGLNFYFQLISLIFFAVYPIGGFIAVWGTKDVLYAGLFTLFILQTLSGLYEPAKYLSAGKQQLFYAVVSLLTCELRRNGLFIVLPTIVAILLFADIPNKIKKNLSLFTGGVLLCFFLLNQAVFPAMGYAKASPKESLSVLFQQTARYLKNHPSDITASEYRTINRVLDIPKIVNDYAPLTADMTKRTYKLLKDPEENKKLTDYFKTAVTMFFRHPLTAIQATMANSFGYYAFTPYFIVEQQEPFDGILCTAPPARFEKIRSVISDFYNDEMVSSLLFTGVRTPVYTWLLILIGLYFCKTGQHKKLLYLLPSTLSILICIASPINGLLRYALPIICAMPVVFAFCVLKTENRTEKHS